MNIKIEKYTLNESVNQTEDLKKIDAELKRVCSELLDEIDEYGITEIRPIEFESRDGFIPHSYNYGGYNAFSYGGIFSGRYNSVIQDKIDAIITQCESDFIEEHGEITESNRVDYESFEQSWLDDNYVVLEPQVMFHGYDESTDKYSATISLVARVSDAPYYRYADWYADYTVAFKNAENLIRQIKQKNLVKKLISHLSN